jgi:hypothetical protein
MKDKKYSLTKNESDRLNVLLGVAQTQEELFNAVTVAYKVYITETVFKRLGVSQTEFKNSVVDLRSGEIVIKEEPKEPEVKK